jgi:hypothetical protein
MSTGDDYRVRAAELHVKAKAEIDTQRRVELELLALSYLRLAEQADRNAQTDISTNNSSNNSSRPSPTRSPRSRAASP